MLPEKLLQTLRLLCVAVIAPESAVPPSWQGPFQTQCAKPRLRSCTLVQGLFSLSLPRCRSLVFIQIRQLCRTKLSKSKTGPSSSPITTPTRQLNRSKSPRRRAARSLKSKSGQVGHSKGCSGEASSLTEKSQKQGRH